LEQHCINCAALTTLTRALKNIRKALSIFGIGKESVFRNVIRGDPVLQSCSKVFALKTLILILWKRQDAKQWFQCFTEDKLSHYCHYLIISYAEKHQHHHHPTSSSTMFLSRRVYLQVMQWLSKINDMDPTNLGWFLKDGKLFSVMMDISPAPERLFKMVRCNCSDDATQ